MQLFNFDHRKVVFYKCYAGVCDGKEEPLLTGTLSTLRHEWTKLLLKDLL
jgi:hypothetical protein